LVVAFLLIQPVVVVTLALAPRESRFRSFPAAVLCGGLFGALGFALMRQLRSGITSTVLPVDALDPAIDESTCGHLLATKRTIDPSHLIHRSPPSPPALKPQPIPYADTMVGRLLLGKQRRHGQDLTGASPQAALWEPWLDR
jgi:hypothetical protein